MDGPIEDTLIVFENDMCKRIVLPKDNFHRKIAYKENKKKEEKSRHTEQIESLHGS